MSKKRTSSESNNDEQTNEGSDSLEDNAKRAKLDLLSDTTLEDLPIELLECILVKAVAMEVKGMKLAKSVWKEKAGPVIDRLRTVCSQWNSILTTNFFRKEVNRALDGTAQETIRMEILSRKPIPHVISALATTKDDIFMLSSNNGYDLEILVYDRSNLEQVKQEIALPGVTVTWGIVACSMEECLYVLKEVEETYSVIRIAKDDEELYRAIPWMSDLKLSLPLLSVSENGTIALMSGPSGAGMYTVNTYNANGSLKHTLVFPAVNYGFTWIDKFIQKPDNNLIVIGSVGDDCRTKVVEINNFTGSVVRQYLSGLKGETEVHYFDDLGRLAISDHRTGIELLDYELNRLCFIRHRLEESGFVFPSLTHYDSEEKQIIRLPVSYFVNDTRRIMTTYKFTQN